MVQPVKNFVEGAAERVAVGDDGSDLLQVPFVSGAGYPQCDVSVRAVFLVHVLGKTPPLSLLA